ncbi:MAG: TRAP transporter permease [Bacillota bacterium]
MRQLGSTTKLLVKLIAIAFSAFYFYTAGFGIISSETHLGVYLLVTFLLALILYPASKRWPQSKLLYALDAILVVLACASVIYWMVEYKEYAALRAGWTNQWDLIFGLIAIVISLEVTRRTMGNVLPTIGLVMLGLTYFGPYLPGIFRHGGIRLSSMVEYFYYTSGIFGTIVSTFATYIVPFLIFGSFLKASGAGDFFIELASSLTGHVAGGPALIAVGGSAVFGSISGSGVANVVATGTFTIPMMKKVGYTPEFAGAVEAAASSGGQLLPPIMGAAAFILATLTEQPYSTIVLISFTPALIYYYCLALMVYFRARRRGLSGLSRAELPVFSQVMKKGWYYIFTIVTVVIVIALGYSAAATAFWGSAFVVVCSMFRKDTRFTFKKFLAALEDAGRSSLSVGATAGTLGIVMASLTLSGLGVKLSSLILSVGQGNLFLTVVLTALIATIIGMGLPTTASYIIMSILAAPSLIQLGVNHVYAHMVCMWFSVISNITPPVCVAAFAAASISGGNPMKTGFQAVPLGIYMYLLPFLFIYRPQVFVYGHPFLSSLEIVVTLMIATVAFAAGFQGWLFRNLRAWERVVYFVAAPFMIHTGLLTDLIGAVVILVMTLYVFTSSKQVGRAVAA